MITRIELDRIVSELDQISKIYFDYEADKKYALDAYRMGALESAIKDAEARARASVSVCVNSIYMNIDKLIAAVEKENDYDISSNAVADAARLLSAPGVSPEAAENVISKFRGNQVALSLLHASASEDIKPFIDCWMFDNVGELTRIKFLANELTYESMGNYPGIVSQIRETIWKFAELQGIEMGSLSDTLEEMKMRNIVGMMGLSWDEIKNN